VANARDDSLPPIHPTFPASSSSALVGGEGVRRARHRAHRPLAALYKVPLLNVSAPSSVHEQAPSIDPPAVSPTASLSAASYILHLTSYMLHLVSPTASLSAAHRCA